MQEKISQIWSILENITDPEIPVLTIVDMGIVRDVKIHNDDVEIIITPTYSGCPAMSVIATSIKMELHSFGWKNVSVTQIYSPAWTTDWMTESGRKKLKDYGIAPPVIEKRIQHLMFEKPPEVPCPRCDSVNTELISEFGSTPCKALMRCKDCLEPFDYFKCHR
ncbi:MAG: phenylacetate-CoA oxygenase subunit PaaJ [Saprospiraceae bacterium]|nr:phenylacetate-CoA oxygenase subunit PaaJ [Saprospiraceae bacterium]MBK8079676.1 phenylacetate-CoA oxygenase subunit PaaJ [Saprospiraceae bacterium]MBK8371448.1 phenylacetate-CoA oxygenase subunit PaaJ [Saprospiraceae bacterium]MBK8818816.1 phenylacetate-CoA oxygenase subunit PaaJ [Saprospiraceae bacterium]MBK8853704.1 phenylacetate-CoA oxygenase subunit PaaJ [Saprospiraceae bacterium]